MITLLTLLTAQAAEPEPGLHLTAAAGWASGINDPFVRRRGPQLSLELGPNDWLSGGVRTALYPNLGELDWRPITHELVEELHISPDISRITMRAEGYARLTPLRRELGPWSSDTGLLIGGGVVRTVDDLAALQAEDDPVALATEVQLHPTWVLGLSAGLRRGPFGLRVDATRLSYTETVMSTTTETKRPVFLGVEATLRLP